MTAQSDHEGWFRTALQLRGSVMPVILPRILLFSSFGIVVSLFEVAHWPIYLQTLGNLTNNVACNLVLGLLLVFRTNTSYERFWEGRKAWGELVVNLRNLAREIQVNLGEQSEQQAEKQVALKLLMAFAIATKLHLRQEPLQTHLDAWLSPELVAKLNQVKNPPLEIVLWLGYYLQQEYQNHQLDINQRVSMGNHLNSLVNGLTSCERILRTPIPIAYAIYLKRLILVYCGLLPFGLVETVHAWTGAVVAMISFVILGVEEIGNEIENPFGTDPNDLPLDQICETVVENITSIMATSGCDGLFQGMAVTAESELVHNGPAQ